LSLKSLDAHEPLLWDLLSRDAKVTLALNDRNNQKKQFARLLEGGDRAGAAKLFVGTIAS